MGQLYAPSSDFCEMLKRIKLIFQPSTKVQNTCVGYFISTHYLPRQFGLFAFVENLLEIDNVLQFFMFFLLE